MPFRLSHQALTEYARKVDELSFAPLLRISSETDAGSEPLWLDFCDYLVNPAQVSSAPSLANDETYQWLRELAMDLWGNDEPSEPLDIVTLMLKFFALERTDQWGGNTTVLQCDRVAAHRALAVAELARQWWGKASGRPRLSKPQLDPGDFLHPQEQRLLEQRWGGKGLGQPSATLPVLLMQPDAAVGDRGRQVLLRLWALDMSEQPDAAAGHGRLFRAPGAAMLALEDGKDAGFSHALAKVETLLRACLKTPDAGGKGVVALAWSFQPLPIPLEGNQQEVSWGMDAVTGESATLAFAVGALWVFREQLNGQVAGVLQAKQWLQGFEPGPVAFCAALAGQAPPDPTRPLDWPLHWVSGLDDKVGSFVLSNSLKTNNEDKVEWALVHNDQPRSGTKFPLETAATISQALETTSEKSKAPLPQAAEALRAWLLEQEHPLDSVEPQTPKASPEVLAPLRQTPREVALWSEVHALKVEAGEPNAIAWHLLRRYARWAGGDHQLWGEPARLAQAFTAIELQAEPTEQDLAKVAQGELSEKALNASLKRNSLYDLLHGADIDQPALWLLTGPPAAGKTTLMAEYEMHMAWRALVGQADHGAFGEIPVWVQARSLRLKHEPGEADGDNFRPLDEAIAEQLALEAAHLGAWPQMLQGSGRMKIRLILDGINELPCNAQRRHALLRDWLAHRFPSGHTHLPPLLTVRTLELGYRFDNARLASLQPWGDAKRKAYIQQRLGGQPHLAQAMHNAVALDVEKAGGDIEKMLFASAGMLSLGCTLMEQGLLPSEAASGTKAVPLNRARLIATLVWARLEGERTKGHLPDLLLGEDERRRLVNLVKHLKKNAWRPPQQPGPLMHALGDQARRMQCAVEGAQIDANEGAWFQGDDHRDALIQAAKHMLLVDEKEAVSPRGDPELHLAWRHQLLLEWYAAFGLSPDGEWPDGVASPEMEAEEKLYDDWKQRKQVWEETRTNDDEAKDYFPIFQLPEPELSRHEETFKLAAQLRGDPAMWVSRLIEENNVPLAARIALDSWGAFGEPLYPQEDPQGPWRPEGKGGTNATLNRLRRALHDRMVNPEVRLPQRIEAGDMLGRIGGSPLFRICGQALVLKDEHWAQIGEPGQTIEFEMGDLLGREVERAADGDLYPVKDLPAFRIAGVLVTNAQYYCFFYSEQRRQTYGIDVWWPGHAAKWFDGEYDGYKIPQSILFKEKMLDPVGGNFWQGQAYGLWESAQRRRVGVLGAGQEVRLPSEAQWEGGTRWAAYQSDRGAQRGEGRWRFAHTQGQAQDESKSDTQGFNDVSPWDFNHDQIVGYRTTPVGVFLRSNVGVGKASLMDVAGNVWEWTVSTREMCLGPAALKAALGKERRALRGGGYANSATTGRVGNREGSAPDSPEMVDYGFRLVLAGVL